MSALINPPPLRVYACVTTTTHTVTLSMLTRRQPSSKGYVKFLVQRSETESRQAERTDEHAHEAREAHRPVDLIRRAAPRLW